VVGGGPGIDRLQAAAGAPGRHGGHDDGAGVAKATQESVPTELKVVGTVEASAIVQVKSQVAGELMATHFTEGQNVAKGDLLFEIDPRPYDDALRQARGRRRCAIRRRSRRPRPRWPATTPPRASPRATPSGRPS
jgi:multidrug efflux pump subunit AcrA (membrane-fusion protein)